MSQRSQTSATVYADMLQEINKRIEAIDHCTAGKSGLPAPFVKDFCYLQLRFIFELIALGCLIAHGDLNVSSDLQKAYAADEIMKSLGRVHQHAYPIPVKVTRLPNSFTAERIKSSLPPAEFFSIYGKLGGNLHRGNLKKLLKEPFPVQVNFPEIRIIAQKAIDLLSTHIIFQKNGKTQILGALHNAADNFKPCVLVLECGERPPANFEAPFFEPDRLQKSRDPR